MIALPPVPAPFYFNAWVLEWHDADTVLAKVDRGRRDYSTWSVRVLGSSAREVPNPPFTIGEPGGEEARDEATRRWPPGTPLVLATVKPDKYGDRQLARVVAHDPLLNVSVDVAAALIADHWAAAWNGRGIAPKPPWPRP